MTLRPIVCVAAVLWGAACSSGSPPPFPPGSSLASEAVPLPDAATHLVWVLQPADYVQCQSHAREVRRAQHQRPGGLPLTVLAVGGHDDWTRAFLSRERLDARIVEMENRAYRREFGRNPRSALYIMTGQRVRAFVTVVERVEMDEGALSAIVERVEREDVMASAGAREP